MTCLGFTASAPLRLVAHRPGVAAHILTGHFRQAGTAKRREGLGSPNGPLVRIQPGQDAPQTRARDLAAPPQQYQEALLVRSRDGRSRRDELPHGHCRSRHYRVTEGTIGVLKANHPGLARRGEKDTWRLIMPLRSAWLAPEQHRARQLFSAGSVHL